MDFFQKHGATLALPEVANEVQQRFFPNASGRRVLDIGSGRRPAVPPAQRPRGCEYVGLDLSAAELAAAAPGAYDETIEADVSELLPSQSERFDLIVGWQVLEHVDRLDRCLENLRSYLRPGGSLVSMLSGRNSGFAAVNLAVHYGAAHIILLGYDMQARKGVSHFFGEHPNKQQSPYPMFRQRFESLVKPLKKIGVTVTNCSRHSALTAFPTADLMATLVEVAA